MENEFKDRDFFREIENFSHLWIIWGFSENIEKGYSSTVRPPKLGGNKKVGVFASRSPFRPNSLGLSCVKLEKVEYTDDNGTVLYVSGIDMLSNTPVYDIKPYIPYTDCKKDAIGGFTEEISYKSLKVNVCCVHNVDADTLDTIVDILSKDPRPSYQNEPDRIYGMEYDKYNIKFHVENNELNIVSIKEV